MKFCPLYAKSSVDFRLPNWRGILTEADSEEAMRNLMCRLQYALFLLFINLAALISAFGQITPSQDSYTNTAASSSNYGTATTLDVSSTSTSIQTAYIQFDLSSIPAGYTSSNVAKATLKLFVDSVSTSGSMNVNYVAGNWTEKGITASLSPALGNTIVSSVPVAGGNVNKYILIDVTSALDGWLNGSQANYGIALVGNSGLAAGFESKENTNQSHPAELDIVFTSGGTITGVTTASGSGLTGGGTSGALNLGLRTNCSTNQVLEWNGGSWVCSSTGAGSVSSVGLSAPPTDFIVSGSPVTGTGTLNFSWNVAPTSASTPNSIVKRDGSGDFSANIIEAGEFTAQSVVASSVVVSSGPNQDAVMMEAFNQATTGSQSDAFFAGIKSTSNGATAVTGHAFGTTGGVLGVSGITDSSSVSAVGVSGTATPTSGYGVGVEGVANS